MQKWLRLALDSARTRGKTQAQVAKEAGISGDTLYVYLRGEGENADPEKISALAEAAGVPVPSVERVLSYSDATVGAPPMLTLLREAGAAIEAATRLLEREEATRAAAPSDDATMTAKRVIAAHEGATDQKPPRPKRGSGGSRAQSSG